MCMVVERCVRLFPLLLLIIILLRRLFVVLLVSEMRRGAYAI